MHITLRPGEKLYLNGAVLRADRKVSIELMNDASFLLEAHVMHVDKATTPLRQLYFVVQTMLISPNDTFAARTLFKESLRRMLGVYEARPVLDGLQEIAAFVDGARYFEALKMLRALFAVDDTLMSAQAGPLALAS